MTEEMQKTQGCLQSDRTESEEYAGVQTVIGISHESLVEVNLSSTELVRTKMRSDITKKEVPLRS